MAQPSTLSRGWDHLRSIARTLGDLQGADTVIYELIQNADDAPGVSLMQFTVSDDALTVWNDGEFAACSDVTTPECDWLPERGYRCDFHSFRNLGAGDKRNRSGTTGAFGIGFIAVYQLTDRPELLSSGEHWIIDEMEPSERRITRSRAPDSATGTTFVLPWARKSSPFRVEISQPPIPAERVDGFFDRLCAAVPRAMPFLKQLSRVEVRGNSGSVTFDRTISDGEVQVSPSRGEEYHWITLAGDLGDRAVELAGASPEVVGNARSSEVTAAFPLDHEMPGGLLYATLPTEQPSHLPVLINADFIPASDRKRIRLDEAGPAGDWNREAIRAVAAAIAANLPNLPETVGDARLVQFLIDAMQLSGQVPSDRLDDCFLAFWEEVVARLPDAAVVPTETGAHCAPAGVRLWDEPAEAAAAQLLEELGIDLVRHAVKHQWYQLRRKEVGLDRLHLGDLTDALVDAGITEQTRPEDLPGLLAMTDSLRSLWSVMQVLLSSNRSNQNDRDAVSECAIAPARDGYLWPVGEVYRADNATIEMLTNLGVDVPFLDQSQLKEICPDLMALVPETAVSDVITWIEDALPGPAGASICNAREALRWFATNSLNLTAAESARIARLPIFPTGDATFPLAKVSLPGNFVDPLGLSDLLVVDEELAFFVRRLGAAELDFATYCIRHVAPRIAAGNLPEQSRRGFLALLARRLSGVEDDHDVIAALEQLRLIPCADGEWRKGSEVYLDATICEIVGPDVTIAVIPTEAPDAHRRLFRWLGVADEPDADDVIDRCRALSRAPVDHVFAAEAVLKYLSRVLAEDAERADLEYSELKSIAWLPARDDDASGFPPDQIYSEFRKSLFASQARFLDMPYPTQALLTEVLTWLGVQSEPQPSQVVDHLLWAVSEGVAVGRDMWAYLNLRHEDAALEQLLGKRCLLISDTNEYVAPSQVFWGDHPFGKYRYKLGDDFAQYQALLSRLEVSEHPQAIDAIHVLCQISRELSGTAESLGPADANVVMACWQLVAEGLDTGELELDDLSPVSQIPTVIDASGRLRRPDEVLFFDSETLVARFGAELRPWLVERPEFLWTAMAAAGVRDLSDAVATDLVSREPARGGRDTVQRRLVDRRRPLLRVLSTSDAAFGPKLDAFNKRTRFERLSELAIQQTVDVGETSLTSIEFARAAIWLQDTSEFLYVEDDDSRPTWVEVAREVSRALQVDRSRSATIASAVKAVLSAGTEDEARRELDELGFPNLDQVEVGAVPAGVASGLGGEAAEDWNDQVDFSTTPHGAPSVEAADTYDEAGADVDEGTEAVAHDEDESGDSGHRESRANHGSTNGSGSEVGGGRPPGGRSRSGTPGSGTQERMRSYVAPARSSNPSDADSTDVDDAVEREGVRAVLEYERLHGREPEEMPPGNVGFDIRSVGSDGVRVIEVKATENAWGKRGVAISSPQFAAAQARREEFWLYIVENALTAPHVLPINDPASKIDQYFFDDGWRAVSMEDRTHDRGLPSIHLATSSRGLQWPVRLLGISPLGPVSKDEWVSSPIEGASYAIQIPGESLGLAARGGLALLEQVDGNPEPNDLVVALLHEQIDPDSGTNLTVRNWRAGDDPASDLILVSSGDVEPLQVAHPADVLVLGRVVSVLDVADLAELGYL